MMLSIPDSANVIYDNTESEEKQLKWYEQSGHVITLRTRKSDNFMKIFMNFWNHWIGKCET